MNRCAICESTGAPHSPLVNIADDGGAPILVCELREDCEEALNERAAEVPYVLGADMDDGEDAR